MAGEKKKGDESHDSDFGNLPPLGDFDTSGGKDEEDGPISGLPPISDINVEVPVPTGGAIKPPPSNLESRRSDFDTPISDFGAGSFPGAAADSDFSPETPALGPGPNSDFETPLFDSAFGGGSGVGQGVGTSTPTQAMETPMFGGANQGRPSGQQQPGGFDGDAFGGGGDFGGFNFEGGTPVPDFSPDTAVPTQPATPSPMGMGMGMAAGAPRGGGGGGGSSILVTVVLVIVALALGLLLGPKATKEWGLGFMPMNPWQVENKDLSDQIAQLESTVAQQKKIIDEGIPKDIDGGQISLEQIAKMQQEIQDLNAQKTKLEEDVTTNKEALDEVERQLATKKDEYLRAEKDYEDLLNQTSIWQARRDGMLSETDRLEGEVGKLQEADVRRMDTKNALEHAVSVLSIQIRDGLPLTPEKFSHDARVSTVDALLAKVKAAQWVDPQLMQEYADLVAKEIEISASRDYFFAKIPTKDRFDVPVDMWAECVMNGNWSVYYRTIDGAHVGVYENVATNTVPQYQFREDLTPELKKRIEETLISQRVPDFEAKIQVLAQNQTMVEDKTEGQRVFDSL